MSSAASAAIAVYHQVTSDGGCGFVRRTGAFNVCDQNSNPFSTISVLDADDIANARKNNDYSYQQIGSISLGNDVPMMYGPGTGSFKRSDTNTTDSKVPQQQAANADNSTAILNKCHKLDSIIFGASKQLMLLEDRHRTAEFAMDAASPNVTEEQLAEKYGLVLHPDNDDATTRLSLFGEYTIPNNTSVAQNSTDALSSGADAPESGEEDPSSFTLDPAEVMAYLSAVQQGKIKGKGADTVHGSSSSDSLVGTSMSSPPSGTGYLPHRTSTSTGLHTSLTGTRDDHYTQGSSSSIRPPSTLSTIQRSEEPSSSAE